MKRDDAVPVRVRRVAYLKAQALVVLAARNGWRSLGATDRDDPPTIAAVIAVAIDQLASRRASRA